MTDPSSLRATFLRLAALALVALLGLVVGCSPNAKNEQQYWDNHQKDMTEFGTRWPGFKPLLDARLTKAKPLFDEASKLTDEKAKAEKMKAANEALAGGFVGKVSQVKYKTEGVQSTIKSMTELKLEKSKQEERAEAIADVQKSLDEIDAAMKNAKPATEEEADKIADEQIGKLIETGGEADRALTALKGTGAAKPKKKK